MESGITRASLVSTSSPVLLFDTAGTFELESPLVSELISQGIKTTDDLRRAVSTGGIIGGIGASTDDPAYRSLVAIAKLSTLSPKVGVLAKLYEKGFESISSIATSRFKDFARTMQGVLDESEIAGIHKSALAQVRLLDNVITRTRSDIANGLCNSFQGHAALRNLPIACHYKESESAVSPLAYLADLLDYAVTRLRYGGSSVDLKRLADTLCQPLGDLPACAEEVDRKIPQVRIAIEVLRRYLAAQGLPKPEARELDYRLQAYQTLLTRIGTSYEEIRLARRAEEKGREALAERLGIDLPAGDDRLEALFLEAATLTEAELERLFGLVDTKRDPLAKGAEPLVLTWRREHLRTLWREQDRPSDDYSKGLLPIIDPDLIGPDDFRNPDLSNPVFKLWHDRHQLVCKEREKLDGNYFRKEIEGEQGVTEVVPDIDKLLSYLDQPLHLPISLHLTPEGRERLMAIKEKDLLWLKNRQNERVTDEEWGEVRSILVQTRKRHSFTGWLSQEDKLAGSLLLGPEHFWISLGEPKEGDWPPKKAPEVPWIDPEVVPLSGLAEKTVGRNAHALWEKRRKELEDMRRELKAKCESDGYAAIVMLALGQDATYEAFSELQEELSSADSKKIDEATTSLQAFNVTVDSFGRLMRVWEKAKSTSSRPPSAAEYAEMYTLLTTAWKEREKLSAWAEEEKAAGINYWNALKARLPRWRATAEARRAWQRALRARSAVPILDPDLVDPGDLKDPDLQLYKDRKSEVEAWLKELSECHSPDGFKASLGQILGTVDLEELEQERKRGHDITPHLEQLGLTLPAFSRLQRVSSLVAAGQDVLDSEWETVDAIFLQVQKSRAYARWRQEEAKAGLTLGPDFFKVPVRDLFAFPPPPPIQRPAWRASREARWEWEDTLQARIDQEKGVIEALAEAVRATEEATLPRLRDALVMATRAAGTTVEAKASWLTERLHIDLQAAGNLQTTRVAQAIEAVQGLLMAARALRQPVGPLHEFHRLARYENWRPAWKAIVPGRFSGSGFEDILLYDQSVGEGEIYATDENGAMTPIAPTSKGWRNTWARVVPGNFSGSGFTDIALYDPSVLLSGKAGLEIYRSDGRGTLLLLKAHNWSTEWDLIVPGNFTGTGLTDLLFYDRETGNAEIFQSDGEGNLTLLKAYSNWRKTWDLIVPGQFGGSGFTDLLFYDSSAGQIEIYAADGLGNIRPLNALPARKTWHAIVPGHFGGGGPADLLFYERGSGDTELYASDSSGNLTQLPTPFSLGSGWDRLVPGRFAAGPYTSLLLYQGNPGAQNGTGELHRIPTWTLDAEDFDEEWKWIGSYAAWRAAMFVFLYPENIVLPSLAPHKTPAFKRLVDDLRSGRRLTAEQARKHAKAYSAYFEDVCSLRLEATCVARARLDEDVRRDLFFMFGRGGRTGKVYWSVWDPEDPTGYAQSFWTEIETLGKVVSVIGAVPYQPAPEQSFICVFAQVQEKGAQKLVVSVRDLEKGEWLEKVELKLPDEALSFSAVVEQHASSEAPPGIVVRLPNPNRKIYRNVLNTDLCDWITDEWEILLDLPHSGSISTLHAVVRLDNCRSYIFWSNESAYLNRMTVDSGVFMADTTLSLQLPAEWIGALPWDAAVPAYAIWRDAQGTHCVALPIDESAGDLTDRYKTEHLYIDLPGLNRLAVHCGGGLKASGRTLAYHSSSSGSPSEPFGLCRANFRPSEERWVHEDVARVAPLVSGLYQITERLSEKDLQARRGALATVFVANAVGPASIRTYLQEAYYLVPMHLALQLSARGEHLAALDWFRTVYDYRAPADQRKIYPGLIEEENLEAVFDRAADWLLDPLNPHAIAATRAETYTRFTLLSIVRSLLAYADAEFTRDTAESVPRARALYLTARELLGAPELKQQLGFCEDLIGRLAIEVGEGGIPEIGRRPWHDLLRELARFNDRNQLSDLIRGMKLELTKELPWEARLTNARALLAEALHALPAPPTFSTVLSEKSTRMEEVRTGLLAHPKVAVAAEKLGTCAAAETVKAISTASQLNMAASGGLEAPVPGGSPQSVRTEASPLTLEGVSANLAVIVAAAKVRYQPPTYKLRTLYIPAPLFQFAVPPNPVLKALRLHVELNLHKIRTGRNIAGMERALDPYAAPTDAVSGLPTIGAGGQLTLPGVTTLRPTPYRYSVLIERAKQLAQMAQQAEAAMLAAIERHDTEAYNLLKARQDVRIARAGVRLQDLRGGEAEAGVKLAEMQRDKAQVVVNHYQELLDQGWTTLEVLSIGLQQASAVLQLGAAGIHILASALPTGFSDMGVPQFSPQAAASSVASAISSTAGALSTQASIFATMASYERREEEWQFQKALAEQDIRIGTQQIELANEHVRVVSQERTIAEMQTDHAEATADFLATKFTNADLYDWMSDTLEGVYSYFLQQGTAMAHLAASQLAFERQEPPPSFLQDDYWEAPSEDALGGGDGGPDRRGLTGSARLLQDIQKLDQYAFETNRRKLNLSKTLSLARLDPYAFELFRKTGVLRFATPGELFDRDFPGHYLRLVRRVRTTVVALVPPTLGIRATLSTTGLSRTVIGGDVFQTVLVRRPPESVALTSPRDATGVFELDLQPEMLLPFEGMGIEATWELRLPKAANPFDYRTLADVLLTIEYTALDSADYRQQVIQTLRPTLSADQPFSLRHQFPDQWFDLNNPDQTATPLSVRFRTRREDFPPNLERLSIQNLVLYLVQKDAKAESLPMVGLTLAENGTGAAGGKAAPEKDGVISTRRPNASNWMKMLYKPPFGEWELSLAPDAMDLIREEALEDILLVVTYSGRLPEWPA